jgi:hypothetical protein
MLFYGGAQASHMPMTTPTGASASGMVLREKRMKIATA